MPFGDRVAFSDRLSAASAGGAGCPQLVTLGDWDSSQGTPYRSRDFAPCAAIVASWDAQAALDDIAATFAAGKVYASVDALAQSLQAQLGALAGADEFLPWVRDNPTFKPRL